MAASGDTAHRPALSHAPWRGALTEEADTREVQRLHPALADWPLDAVCEAWEGFSRSVYFTAWLSPTHSPPNWADFLLYLHATQVCPDIETAGQYHPEYDRVTAMLLARHGPL